ncbi:MAG: DUF4383 domain-containing protein [Mycobacteriaceae bacterium]
MSNVQLYARHTGALGTVHRVGAAVMGLVLWAFGILGLVSRLGFFETSGDNVAGLSSNGLLSVISLVVGAVLIAAGARGGRSASTVTAGVGALFILSGLVNLAFLDTSLNILNFTIPNVFFSFVVGMILLLIGLYGRVSGGLSSDNPYRREREGRSGDDDTERDAADQARLEEINEQVHLEQLVAEGMATPEQEAQVGADRARRAQEQHDAAWEHARRTGQAPIARQTPTRD